MSSIELFSRPSDNRKVDNLLADLEDLAKIVSEQQEGGEAIDYDKARTALFDSIAYEWSNQRVAAQDPVETAAIVLERQSKLAMAIIMQTARDVMSKDKKNRKARLSAVFWLNEREDFEPYTLRYCCAIINAQLRRLTGEGTAELTPERLGDAILNNPQVVLGFSESTSRITASPVSERSVDSSVDVDGLFDLASFGQFEDAMIYG